MTRVCLHVGVHDHPIMLGEDQGIKERTRQLIEEQAEKTPKATNFAIVMQASKVTYLLIRKGWQFKNSI